MNGRGPSLDLAKLGVIRTGDVEPRNVVWLWLKRIPMRTVTLLAGIGGQGKSQIIAWLAGELTTGRMTGNKEPILILSAEDPVPEVLNPRLRAVGADQDLVYTLQLGDNFTIPHDLENGRLAEIVKDLGVRVLVIDPIVAYMDGSTDSHKTQDVRRMLKMLAAVAERGNVAVIVVMHFKKGEAEGNIIHKVSGAAGFGDAARSGLVVAQDPRWEGPDADAPFVLLHVKNNYGKLASPLKYHIESYEFTSPAGVVIATSHVVWDGEDSSLLVEEVFGRKPGPGPEDRRDAEDFLCSWLADGPALVDTLKKAAKKAAISDSTLRRAKDSLKVESEPVRDPDTQKLTGWMWRLPDVESFGHLGQVSR